MSSSSFTDVVPISEREPGTEKVKAVERDDHDFEKGHVLPDGKGSPTAGPDADLAVDDEVPDGGYGWLVVACLFASNFCTWGQNSSFGVFLAYYLDNDYFHGATPLQFAFIGGLSTSQALLIAPLANYLSKRWGFKVPMKIGTVSVVAAQILAGFTREIWQLFLTQGLLFGWGMGLIFVPSLPIASQWFSKRRALAVGIVASGSGGGALVLSNTTNAAIQNLGLRYAFVINGLITFVMMVPVIIFLKSRTKDIGAKFEPLEPKWIWHKGFVWVLLWGFFSMFGYIVPLFSLSSYAVSLGLSKTQSSALSSIIGAGNMVGRPLCGVLGDYFGRVNSSISITIFAGVTCFVIWMVSESYGVLILFAILQGISGGVFWTLSSPVAADVIGLRDLGSALSILYLAIVIPTTTAEAIALSLVQREQDEGMTGTDSFRAAIGFAGGCFVIAGVLLYGAKRFVQGTWRVFGKC